jgi:putative flippase GtrA
MPAILFSSASDSSLAVARELLAKSYPVLALCGQDGADAWRGAGAVLLGVSGDAALRAGLEYMKEDMPGLAGLVYVETEMGYSSSDIEAVAGALEADPGRMAIASRVRGGELGLAERLVARAAHWAFAAAHGRPVRDPWSGLAGLPAAHIDDFLGEKGCGKNYLFRLLLTMQRHGIKAENVPVRKPYGRIRGDTWKERMLDIAKIALMPLLFISSSLTLSAADFSLSFLFFYLLLPGNKPVSIVIGRFTGALVGYLLNRNIVFAGKGGHWRAEAAVTAKYAALFACMYCMALLLVSVMVDNLHMEFALAQVISGILLYAPNYLLQRDLVFGRVRPRPVLREGASNG